MRAALQAALLHGRRDQLGSGRCRVPAARRRGAGTRRPDRGAHRAVAGRARLQPGDARCSQPRRVRARRLVGRHDQGGPRRRTGGHRFVRRDRPLVGRQGHHHSATHGEHPRRRGGARRRPADVPQAVRRRPGRVSVRINRPAALAEARR